MLDVTCIKSLENIIKRVIYGNKKEKRAQWSLEPRKPRFCTKSGSFQLLSFALSGKNRFKVFLQYLPPFFVDKVQTNNIGIHNWIYGLPNGSVIGWNGLKFLSNTW